VTFPPWRARAAGWLIGFGLAAVPVACGTGNGSASTGGASGSSSIEGGAGVGGAPASGGSAGAANDAGQDSGLSDAAGQGGEASVPDSGATADTLDANRNRLLKTYLEYLKQNPTQTQSNGLSGSNVSSACDLWQKLDPSSQAVFLTLTARMQGSILGQDGTSMLSHVTRVYRISGGQGATATAPGSCGGGEYNRMIMSMDPELQAAQLAANQHQGARQPNGKYDIADIPSSSYWRNSHDVGGPHSPFDLSDETNQGAPRGQTQYFSDPTSALAHSPLGRMDLTTLVDPYALEMDQDYDCVHNSNPLCTYVTYGPLCAPETSLLGTAVYTKSYGSFDPGFSPTCP
jgi:hypothetical protein